MRARESHIFEREEHDHYVEEKWCARRLFEEVPFVGPILDPACGWGRILDAAAAHGYGTKGSDVVDRGASKQHAFRRLDFTEPVFNCDDYQWWRGAGAIVSNPPFDIIETFTSRALTLTRDFYRPGRVALIYPTRRLPAATWLKDTPLQMVLHMNPRPSMPTGAFIEAAERGDIDPKTGKPCKVGGGTQDFSWLIWDHSHFGPASMGWLEREGRRGA